MDEIYNITSSEYQALVDLYNTTAGSDWIWLDGPGIPWNFTHYDNPCYDFWQGVTCSDFPVDGYLHITELDLSSHDLEGYLPESIGNLVYLQNLSLSDSELYEGTIPESIGQLVQLKALLLRESFINGTIPDSIGNLTELVTLDLGNNNLYGTIPLSVCNLNQLVNLDLSANFLKGIIPDCFGQLTDLFYLNIYLNRLSGSIPASLGNLTQLVVFGLYENHLTGTIPDTLSALTGLLQLALSNNLIRGTIPSWVGNLIHLTSFGVNSNLMNGTIPSEFGNLLQMDTLLLDSNDFTGTLPLSFANLVSLSELYVSTNRLSGPFPAYLGSFSLLQYIVLYENYLTGTFPADIGRATNLVEINIRSNLIEGPLPSSLSNCSMLVAIVMSNNKFTGAIPSSLLFLPQLRVVELGANRLSGALPEASPVSPVLFFSVGYNSLTGSIPASLGSVQSLVNMNLSFNYLTNTLPEEISSLASLNFLYLSNNLLTGPLPLHWEDMSVLSYVFMDGNFFCESIPSTFGLAPLLSSLNLSRNHLTGTIPVTFAQLPLLEVLLLQDNALVGNIDGVLNSSYQQSLTTVQFSNNQLTGTLPGQLFLSNTLTVFAAVSNCFTGSIPLTLCNSTSINTLALDGLQSATSCRRALFSGSWNGIVADGVYTIDNPLTGGVPSCLFGMANLTTLHLSGNGLTGSISEDVSITPSLVDLSLSHNRLTGSIPSLLLDRSWINLDLSYNVFSHSLPMEGHGVNSRNASIFLEKNRLSGKVPKILKDVETISILESNLFACNPQGSDLPSHDPNIDKYQCGSDTLNETLYAWLAVASLIAVVTGVCWHWRAKMDAVVSVRLEKLLLWWRDQCEVPELANYAQLNAVIEVILRLCGTCSFWCFCVLMPIYIAMSATYGTYTHQYAWTLSAAYLSGKVPFALLFLFLVLLIVVGYLSFWMLTNSLPCYYDTGVGSTGLQPAPASIGRRVVVYICYILLTFMVVMGVNVAYVVIALNENGNALTTAQFALAVFKVGFNSLCSPWLIRSMSYYFLRDASCRDFVSIQLIVGLVNNIAIPCLVVAIISPSCFYNIFKVADSVQSSYSYNGRCLDFNTFNIKIVDCDEEQLLVATTSYDPPFEYSYQCSSSFITYYAPAYVIMCILAGVAIPVVQVSLQVLHARATQGTRWFALLDLVLPRILKPISTTSSRSMFVLYFDAQQHLTTILNYLGLLLTFGAVFPPLAICFLVTMVSIAAFARLKVGHFLHLSGDENATICVQIINAACVGAGNLVKLHRAVLTVLVFSCIFYTLFLFDTLGDAVGFAGAYWVLIVVPLIPISLYFIVWLATNQVRVESVANTATLRDEAKREIGDVELQCMEGSAVQNPIVMKETP